MKTCPGFWSVFAAIIVSLNVTALAAAFAGGTGEPNNPYQIATAEQLISIGSDPNLLDKHFVLVADIDLDPNISPSYAFGKAVIGNYWVRFTGLFDGAGFRIRHLTIRGDMQFVDEWLGLFCTISPNGKVQRLVLEDVEIVSGAKWSTMGGLCAQNDGTICRCSVTGSVSGLDESGGLVGYNGGTIEESSAVCTVSGSTSGGLSSGGRGIVARCYASGYVSGQTAGGLMATADYQVVQCHAACRVDSNGPISGGLIGRVEGRGLTVIDSYFLSISDGGGPDNGLGMPLTTLQMKQAASFKDWDFWGIGNDGFRVPWFMPAGNYPQLTWLSLKSVPNVAGMSAQEAFALLENAGIAVGDVTWDYDHTAAYGHVAVVNPSAAELPGKEVNVVLSLGPYNWPETFGKGDANEPYLILTPGQLDCLAYQPQL